MTYRPVPQYGPVKRQEFVSIVSKRRQTLNYQNTSIQWFLKPGEGIARISQEGGRDD